MVEVTLPSWSLRVQISVERLVYITYELGKSVSSEVCEIRVSGSHNYFWTSLFQFRNKACLISQMLSWQTVKYFTEFGGEEYLTVSQNFHHS